MPSHGMAVYFFDRINAGPDSEIMLSGQVAVMEYGIGNSAAVMQDDRIGHTIFEESFGMALPYVMFDTELTINKAIFVHGA